MVAIELLVKCRLLALRGLANLVRVCRLLDEQWTKVGPELFAKDFTHEINRVFCADFF